MPQLRYIALRKFSVGTVAYDLGDELDATGMSGTTLSGLSSMGWVGTTLAGDVGKIHVSSTAPTAPEINDLWIDIS